MKRAPQPGDPAPVENLADIPALITAFFTLGPDPTQTAQLVSFGTSGHRGSSLDGTFNEAHILAICQAVCAVRARHGVDGPLFLGRDTHALSAPAHAVALEVLAANGVIVRPAADDGYTPTPAVSHAILVYNRGRSSGRADGLVITPSHNPPGAGGIKYNPPSGGPAPAALTAEIEAEANAHLRDGNRRVKRMPWARARRAATTKPFDFIGPYVRDLATAVDLEAIRGAGLRLAADALGGAGFAYWAAIAEEYGLDLTVLNGVADPTFRFMHLDHDGAIRMDCSSAYAMTGLVALKDRYDLAFGNDPDFDRHGIVTPEAGLMNPNHYLAVAVQYLFTHRPGWPVRSAVGKTLVSSGMIDRVAAALGRDLIEVPVGFKWFVDGLLDGGLGFGGEESAGASFLRRDGTVWTTDKDGILLALLAAEITAVTGATPSAAYRQLTERFGTSHYARLDASATAAQRQVLKALDADDVSVRELGGEPVREILTRAPGNGEPIGGIKVTAENGWFAARPSGTEDIYKIYAESFLGPDHLRRLQDDAKALVNAAFVRAGAG